MSVADKINFINRRQRTFINFINKINTVVFTFNNLRLNHNGITPRAFINFKNTLNIILGLGFAESRAWRQLNFRSQHIAVHIIITVKIALVDNRALNHGDNQFAAWRNIKSHIIKQTGSIKLFQSIIKLFFRNTLPRLNVQIRHYRFVLNAIQPRNGNIPNINIGSRDLRRQQQTEQ